MLSVEHKRRVVAAMVETQTALTRAMRYSPDFRDNELIAFYHRHIAKLNAMLASGGRA